MIRGAPPIRWIQAIIGEFYDLTYREKVITIILFGAILQGALIAFDQASYHGLIELDYGRSVDIKVFRERGETILSGDCLYRDVRTKTPPVVNYVLVIPVLFGGSLLAFQVFFSACVIVAALMMFELLRRRNERRASLAALLFLMNPFSYFHSTINCQDEPLIVLFFFTPLVLLLSGRFRESAVATGVGIWTKMWPLLLTPLYFFETRNWRKNLLAVALILVVSALIVIPFLVICPDDFLWFIRFYFLGIETEEAGGVALWRFLDDIGLKPPSVVMLALVGTAILGGYWYSHKKGWDSWRSISLVVILFFLVYPKLHSGYYLLPLILLLPYIVDSPRLWSLTFLLFATVIGAHKFHVGSFDTAGGLIAIPIALAIATDLVLVYLLRETVLKPHASELSVQ